MRTAVAIVVVASATACRNGDVHRAVPITPAVPTDATVARDGRTAAKREVPEQQPSKESPLIATLDGAPVAIASIVSYRRAGIITTVASTRPLDCEAERRGGWKRVVAGEVRFEVEWSWELKPDGSSQPALKRLVYDGSSISDGRWLVGSADASSGTATSVTVEFTNTDARDHHTLHVAGALRSTGCAVHDPPVVLPPAQPATIEIAGHSLPVRFAELQPRSDTADATLVLTTGDESCDPDAGQSPSAFSVSLEWLNADDREVGAISAGGTALGWMGGGITADDDIAVTPRPRGAGMVTLHGTATVLDYPVRIDGTVHVQVCPQR